MSLRRRWSVAALAALIVCGSGAAGAVSVLQGPDNGPPHRHHRAPPPPYRWPFTTVQIGEVDNEGGAAPLRASAPFGLRYHYLSGGVNTGRDWQSWATGSGSFIAGYVRESVANHLLPVFSYYEMRQSLPGAKIADEQTADITNLQDRRTMRRYFQNLQRLMILLGAQSPQTVVLHVEPDLWGYVEKQVGDDASRQPADVALTGLPELKGYPNTVAGFARAIVALRDRYAPNVLLGYQLSVFGTDKDLHTSALTLPQVDQVAARSTAFYRSLGAHFNLMFAEFTNSDAGYQQVVLKQPDTFWQAIDYQRQVRYLGDIYRALHIPTVLWQIPVGNTVFRTDDNTTGHYQDNRVQWLLGPGGRAHLDAYVHAGVIALLFGTGVTGGTCACDARHDGITNPPPIDGNTLLSHSKDDDGGYLVAQTRAYYRAAGGVRLGPQLTARVRALGRQPSSSPRRRRPR